MTSDRHTHTDGLGLLLNIGLLGVRALRYVLRREAHPFGKPAALSPVRDSRTPRASLTSCWSTLSIYTVLNSGHIANMGPYKGLNSVYRRCKCLFHNIPNPVTKGIYGDFTGGRGVFSLCVPLAFLEQNQVSTSRFHGVHGCLTGRSGRFSA